MERARPSFVIDRMPEELRETYLDYISVLDDPGKQYLVNVPGFAMNRGQLAEYLKTHELDDPAAIAATLHFMDYTIKNREQRGLPEVLTQEAVTSATIRRFQQVKADVLRERE